MRRRLSGHDVPEDSGTGWLVPSPDPRLPARFEDSQATPAWRRALELNAQRRAN